MSCFLISARCLWAIPFRSDYSVSAHLRVYHTAGKGLCTDHVTSHERDKTHRKFNPSLLPLYIGFLFIESLHYRLAFANIRDDDAQYPDIDEKEHQTADPQTRHERAPSKKLELIALLQPYNLFRVNGPS